MYPPPTKKVNIKKQKNSPFVIIFQTTILKSNQKSKKNYHNTERSREPKIHDFFFVIYKKRKLANLRTFFEFFYIIPGIPCGIAGAAGPSSGLSATTASVVNNNDETDAAF